MRYRLSKTYKTLRWIVLGVPEAPVPMARQADLVAGHETEMARNPFTYMV